MLIPILILSGLGATAALGLGIAARVFRVETDPKLEELLRVLPGGNCGACGNAGCNAFGEALLAGEAEVNDCTVSSDEDREKAAEILGVEYSPGTREVAVVRCAGTASHAKNRFQYAGAHSCRAARDLHGGPKVCPNGCLGLGDCVTVCPEGAIEIRDGVARIIEKKCIGCRLCVGACPVNVIGMKPVGQNVIVLCCNTQKPKETMKACGVGCIGCKKCVKACPADAIKITDFLASIDPEKCTDCGDCAEACPTNCIEAMLPSGQPEEKNPSAAGDTPPEPEPERQAL